MKKLLIRNPGAYYFLIVLIGTIIAIFLDIKILLMYILIIYLIDSNIRTNLTKRAIYILDKQNEKKLFSVAKKNGVSEKEFMEKIEIGGVFSDEESKKETKKTINETLDWLLS